MDEVKVKIARNEAIMRNSNYRIEEAAKGLEHEVFRAFCECGYGDCRDKVELTISDYDRIRAHPRRFFVVKGHEIPFAEDVVERQEKFFVVEKPEEAQPILSQYD